LMKNQEDKRSADYKMRKWATAGVKGKTIGILINQSNFLYFSFRFSQSNFDEFFLFCLVWGHTKPSKYLSFDCLEILTVSVGWVVFVTKEGSK
jgi:hypothetical protein